MLNDPNGIPWEEIRDDPELIKDRYLYGSSYVKMTYDPETDTHSWERLDPRPIHGWPMPNPPPYPADDEGKMIPLDELIDRMWIEIDNRLDYDDD